MSKLEKVVEIVKEMMGEGYDVSPCTVNKNNGLVFHGITVGKKEENVRPNIYIDGIIAEESEGKVAEYVCRKYKESSRKVNIDIDEIIKREFILDNVIHQIVNKERNAKRIRNIPHTDLLDMTYLYIVMLNESNDGASSYVLNNEMLKKVGISMGELEKAAEVNTEKKLGVTCAGLEKVMMSIMYGDSIEEDETVDFEREKIIVLTGKNKTYGASFIGHTGIIGGIADVAGTDLLILPSSIHEILILKDDGEITPSELKEIVASVNSNEVPEDEVLSDNVYRYRKDTRILEIAQEL